ncbi:MAG: hypothetical protein WC314_13970 [Vulcanimicrobiota bacterium]
MKNYLALLALLLALAVGAHAEEADGRLTRGPSMLATLNIVQISDSQLKKLEGVQKTNTEIPGKVLQSLEVMTIEGMASLVHLGEKWPIIYYDPRAEQFQIQYVDFGGKLDLTCKESGPNGWKVEIRPEISALYEIEQMGDVQRLEVYPKTTVLIAESTIQDLKFGETSVFAKITGRAAQSYLEAMGLPSDNANLLYTLRLEPQS